MEPTNVVIERLDLNKNLTLDDCYDLLPKPLEGFRGTEFSWTSFWSFVLFTRGLSRYPVVIPSQWELYIISGKEPKAKLLMTSTEQIFVKEVSIRHTFAKEFCFNPSFTEEALVQIFTSEQMRNAEHPLLSPFLIHIEGELR